MASAATEPAHDLESQSEVPNGGRPVHSEINLSKIASNVRALKSVIGPRCKVMAVVKADGYGLGAPWVAAAALEGGASWLGVACVDEGVQLRQAGYSGPILVMSYVPPEEASAVVRNKLALVLHNDRTACALEVEATALGMEPGEVPVHVKVDTGLGRYGCTPAEFWPLVRSLLGMPHLRLQGLMTHFADADNPDLTFAYRQLERFNNLRLEAEERGIHFEIVHAANSAAALSIPEARFDMVRSGILLSGHLPAAHLRSVVSVEPAVCLRSSLARVYEAAEGDTVGYGRTWTCTQPSLIGLVTVGYADGYRRAFSNRAEMLVRGRRVPVVGRVSMDQVCVDLTGIGGAAEGEDAVILGRQGSEEITAEELASWADTISYEILTGLSARLPKHYFHSGERMEVCNLLGCSPRKARKRTHKELSR